ncbi:MAG TPA: DUF4386 domain-containing protein [Actinomycetota bacterium]|nr:DUF4386 domain-containing protein [Actinomycetota bacterium]
MKTEPLDRIVGSQAVLLDRIVGSQAVLDDVEPKKAARSAGGGPRRRRLDGSPPSAGLKGRGPRISARRTSVIVGVLFFVQMITFMIGSSMVQAFVDGGAGRATLLAGVLLEMCSGLAIVGIGFLMYPILKTVNQKLAVWYPAMRVAEFAVSAACAAYLLTRLEPVPNYLLWIYIPTGIGGLVLTYLLYVSRLVPRPLALLGLVGYGLLLMGVPVDLFSSIDMNEGAGLALLAPGGLFEFVFFPIWLIARGFKLPGEAAG